MSITKKIILLSIILIVGTAFFLTNYFFNEMNARLTKLEIARFEGASAQLKRHVEQAMIMARTDGQRLLENPALDELVRTVSTRHEYAISTLTIKKWQDRISESLGTVVLNNRAYKSMRVGFFRESRFDVCVSRLEAANRKKEDRIVDRCDIPSGVKRNAVQNSVNANFIFVKTPMNTYEPFVAVLIPITREGRLKAFIEITILCEEALLDVARNIVGLKQLVVANDTMDYVVYHRFERWSGSLNKDLVEVFPAFKNVLNGTEQEFDLVPVFSDLNQEIAHFEKIRIDETSRNDYLGLGLVANYRDLIRDTIAIRDEGLKFTIWMVIIALMIAILFAKRITQPLVRITRAAAAYTRGEKQIELPYSGTCEIGMLTDSLRRLITTVEQQKADLGGAKATAEKAAHAKGMFLANMSHEIRTPLNSVIGMVDVLRETTLSSDQAEYVKVIQHSAVHLLSVINSILDFSKIESGSVELESIPFTPRHLLEEVRSIVAAQASKKNLQLLIANTLKPCVAVGDPTRLRQILINLSGNAIKFTKAGSVSIVLSGLEADKGLRVEVRDTGIGIPADKLGSIFESFTQADSSTTRNFGGTGLGLSISKKLVELMGGQITVRSEFGRGTTFQIDLPLELQEPRAIPTTPLMVVEEKEPDQVTPSPPVETGKMRILVVDDTRENRFVIQSYFKGMNIELVEAENGAMAFEKASTEVFDLVLMDMQMPVLDGYEATKKIRDWEKANGKTPMAITALTASTVKEERDRCLAMGCDSYLSKPVRKKDLVHLITSQSKKAA